MGWYEVKRGNSGPIIPDGNDIEYPISQLPTGNKAYLEDSIQEISRAIQIQASSTAKYKVSEMGEAILGLRNGGGYIPYELLIYTDEYTESDLPETEND